MASLREMDIGGRWSERSRLLGFGEEWKSVRWQSPWFALECAASLVCSILSLSQGEERLGSGSGPVAFVTWDVALWISDLLFHLGKGMPRVQEGRVCPQSSLGLVTSVSGGPASHCNTNVMGTTKTGCL